MVSKHVIFIVLMVFVTYAMALSEPYLMLAFPRNYAPVVYPTTSSTTSTTTSTTSTTMAPPPSSTSLPSTTTSTIAPPSVYECVQRAGFDPNSFVYVYEKKCGEMYLDRVVTASNRKGIEVTKIDLGLVKEKELMILQCFYGKYTLENKAFTDCPRLMCPKTGDIKTVDAVQSVQNQFDAYALYCKNPNV